MDIKQLYDEDKHKLNSVVLIDTWRSFSDSKNVVLFYNRKPNFLYDKKKDTLNIDLYPMCFLLNDRVYMVGDLYSKDKLETLSLKKVKYMLNYNRSNNKIHIGFIDTRKYKDIKDISNTVVLFDKYNNSNKNINEYKLSRNIYDETPIFIATDNDKLLDIYVGYYDVFEDKMDIVPDVQFKINYIVDLMYLVDTDLEIQSISIPDIIYSGFPFNLNITFPSNDTIKDITLYDINDPSKIYSINFEKINDNIYKVNTNTLYNDFYNISDVNLKITLSNEYGVEKSFYYVTKIKVPDFKASYEITNRKISKENCESNVLYIKLDNDDGVDYPDSSIVLYVGVTDPYVIIQRISNTEIKLIVNELTVRNIDLTIGIQENIFGRILTFNDVIEVIESSFEVTSLNTKTLTEDTLGG